MTPEPPFSTISDILIYTRYGAVAPNLQEVVRQADQAPFALDLLQATQREAAETAHALDLAEHRLDHPLAQAVHGSTPRRPQLRPHLLLRGRTRRQWCHHRRCGRPVVLLPL